MTNKVRITPIIAIDPNMRRVDGLIPVMVDALKGATFGDPVIACEEEGGDYWDAVVVGIGQRVASLRVDWLTHRTSP